MNQFHFKIISLCQCCKPFNFFSFQVNLPWSVLCHYRLSYLQLDCLSYHYLKSSAKMVNIIFSDVAGLKTVTMWHLFDIIHDTIVPLAWHNASRYDRFHETWKKSHSTDDRAFKVSQNHLDVMVYIFKKSGDVRKIFWSCWLRFFSFLQTSKPSFLPARANKLIHHRSPTRRRTNSRRLTSYSSKKFLQKLLIFYEKNSGLLSNGHLHSGDKLWSGKIIYAAFVFIYLCLGKSSISSKRRNRHLF